MQLQREDIESIVSEVLKKLTATAPAAAAGKPEASGDWGVFDRLEDAVAAAAAAYRRLDTVALRERVVDVIRRAARANARRLAEMAVDETGMGRIEDKVRKNLLVADRTPGPETLYPSAMSGDTGLTLVENAAWGVIASVTPSTNPAATVINNSISMISGGNAVVFAPHPAAKRVTQEAIRILNKAIVEEAGINNLMTCVRQPTIETAQQLFTFPGIHLLVVTGGEAVVDAARKTTNKRLIAAGAGNPPAVVDATADLPRAARSLYDGASFDNNIVCCDEKEIIAVDAIANDLKRELAAARAGRGRRPGGPAGLPRPQPAPKPPMGRTGRDGAGQGRRLQRAGRLPAADRGCRPRGRLRFRPHRGAGPQAHRQPAFARHRPHGRHGATGEHEPVRQERPLHRGTRRRRRGLDLHDHFHADRRRGHQRAHLRAPAALHPGGQLPHRLMSL